MSDALQELITQLKLDPVTDKNNYTFIGQSTDILGSGRIFGGQVLGQALTATANTVSSTRLLHSMHAYFIRPGDTRLPIIFEVENMRDGGSFSVRRVVAKQQDKMIFNMTSSFQTTEMGLEHASAMPQDIPDPLSCPSERELAQQMASKFHSSAWLKRSRRELPIEIKIINPEQILSTSNYAPKSLYWFKANGVVADDPNLHKCLFAYVSDFYLLTSSLLPHNQSPFAPNMQIASLDHAIWFHRPFNVNEWLLYSIESPNASGGRGLCLGKVFNQQGQLVASTAQEGLIRLRKV